MGLIEAQLGEVGRAQGIRVLGPVLLVVGLVDPFEGIHEHVIEGGRDVAHEAHEEEGDLQHRVGDEVQAPDQLIVPGHGVEIEDEGEEPERELHGNYLLVQEGQRFWLLLNAEQANETLAHGNCNQQSDGNASGDCDGRMTVDFSFEETWVL